MKKRRSADFYAILLSVFYVLLGLVLIIWPASSALTICYAVGALFILAGLFYSICYFTKNHYNSMLGQSLAIGLVLLVIGLFVILRAESILKAMPFMIGVLLVFDSATKVQAALDLRRTGYSRWSSALLIGAVTAVLGLILIWNPFSAVVVLNIFIGVCLILNAVANLLSALLLSRRYKQAERQSDSDPDAESEDADF